MPSNARARSASRSPCPRKNNATACGSCATSSANSTCTGGPGACCSMRRRCAIASVSTSRRRPRQPDFEIMDTTEEDLETPRPSRFVRPPPPPLARDCALFLDIDGTLAELANVPDAVRIDEELAGALPKLAQELSGALALVTGRAITSADKLFPTLKLPMAGQHGCERRDAAGTIHLHAPRKETYA